MTQETESLRATILKGITSLHHCIEDGRATFYGDDGQIGNTLNQLASAIEAAIKAQAAPTPPPEPASAQGEQPCYLATSAPEHSCMYAIDNAGNIYRRYSEPVCRFAALATAPQAAPEAPAVPAGKPADPTDVLAFRRTGLTSSEAVAVAKFIANHPRQAEHNAPPPAPPLPAGKMEEALRECVNQLRTIQLTHKERWSNERVNMVSSCIVVANQVLERQP